MYVIRDLTGWTAFPPRALSVGGREANPMMTGVVGSPAACCRQGGDGGGDARLLARRLAKHNKVASFVMMAALNRGTHHRCAQLPGCGRQIAGPGPPLQDDRCAQLSTLTDSRPKPINVRSAVS
jgi:hypothetical protein